MAKKLTYQEFIKKLKHSDKYDYSLLTEEWFIKNYKNTKTQIPIICKKCNNKYYPSFNDHNMTKGGCALGCWGNRSSRLTFNEFKERIKDYLKENNYNLIIDEQWWQKNYKSKKKTKVKILDKNVSKDSSQIFIMSVEQILAGYKNPNTKSERFKMSFRDFLARVKKRAKNKFKNYYLLINEQWWQKNYENINTKIPLKCKKHKKIVYQTVTSFFNPNYEACKKCGYLKIKRTYKSYKDEISKIFPDYKFENLTEEEFQYRYTNNHKTRIKVYCQEHGWFERPLFVLQNGLGCPKCSKKSKGEEAIQNFLEKNKIDYIREWKLPETQTRLDFYLPKYNIAIEYDGIQHFKPIDFAGKGQKWARERFREDKQRDFLKNKLCHIYKINLIRIPYWNFKNLKNYILKIFKREKIKI